MPFLKHENSTTPTQLVALQRAGTKFVTVGWRSAPATEWWPRSLGLVGRARNEDSTWSGEKTPKSVPTKDLCHQYTARCSVSFYKKFHCHQPVEMNASESPFYLAAVSGIINAQMKKFGMWRHPGLGKNKIQHVGKFLSTAAKNAGLHREGKKSSQSFCVMEFVMIKELTYCKIPKISPSKYKPLKIVTQKTLR